MRSRRLLLIAPGLAYLVFVVVIMIAVIVVVIVVANLGATASTRRLFPTLLVKRLKAKNLSQLQIGGLLRDAGSGIETESSKECRVKKR